MINVLSRPTQISILALLITFSVSKVNSQDKISIIFFVPVEMDRNDQSTNQPPSDCSHEHRYCQVVPSPERNDLHRLVRYRR